MKKHPQKRAYFGLTKNLRQRRGMHRLARGDKKLKLFKIFLCPKGSESFYERYAISSFWNRVGKDKSLNISSGGMGRKPGRKFIYWYVTQKTKNIQQHPLGFPYSFITKYRRIRKLDLSNCVIPVIDLKLGRISIISLLDLKEHTHLRKQTARAFQCKLCQYSNDSENQLKRHENDHVTCTICGVVSVFSKPTKLMYHIKKFHPDQNSEDFKTIFVRAIDNTTKCQYCGEVCADAGKLHSHKKKFHRIVNCVVENCPHKFTQRKTLYEHLRAKHPVEWQRITSHHKCPICQTRAVFLNDSEVQQHITDVHSGTSSRS